MQNRLLWDRVALACIALLTIALAWWFVQFYFGDSGVRVTALGVALLLVLALVYVMFAGAVRMVTSVHNNTIQGIVDFQAADDRGEVARSKVLAEVVRGASRNGQDATRLAQQMTRGMLQTERAAIRAQPETAPVDRWIVDGATPKPSTDIMIID